MTTLQFFYDYHCPHCKRGFEHLMKEIKKHPDIEIEYRPIELNPSPKGHPPHTSFFGQCYYIARELSADTPAFHAAMFQAIAVEHQDADDPRVLCGILKGIADTDKLKAMLDSGKYAARIDENNDLAYEKNGVWYLPAFRMNGKKLDAKGGVGISEGELRNFLEKR